MQSPYDYPVMGSFYKTEPEIWASLGWLMLVEQIIGLELQLCFAKCALHTVAINKSLFMKNAQERAI